MSYDLGPRPHDVILDPTEFAKILKQPVALGTVTGDLDDIEDGTTYVRFSVVEQTKLSGIETGATADQTGAEIKALYEAEADTNAFTDAQVTKLAGIETAATADQSDAEIETAYNNQVSVVSQADAEAGTSTTVYRWTPERVGQAIQAQQLLAWIGV